MSGIAGLVDLDGAPVDARLLRRMTESMRYRGPDAQAVWAGGPAGLGHALLRTAASGGEEPQPCGLDDAWIAADARIDDRHALLAALASSGRAVAPSATDAELLLHAYRAWGTACVERLRGDFSFAIWDAPARRLFCARDRFGVKPFYYAETAGAFVFSNTLDCVRMHPAVGDALNDRAVGDFLLFGFNEDAATTTFAAVQRLPPAHTLTIEGGTARRRCYWTLPADGRIRYRRSHEYVEHFDELLTASVGDRVRGDRAGIWMSGGLDSTSIAAIARRRAALRAYSIVYDALLPDVERPYIALAARALDLPVDYFDAAAYPPFAGWGSPALHPPEPACDPFLAVNTLQAREAAGETRVLLCGDGGDESLAPSTVAALARVLPATELAAGIARSLLSYRQRPAAGLRPRPPGRPPYPGWLNRTFERRLDLPGRWAQHASRAGEHPLRPDAYRRLTMAYWPSYFESWDPGVTRAAVEPRYPFLDVRLVEYLIAIPPIPWCVDKRILRESMRGRLPESIRSRPKTPLAGDPLVAHLLNAGAEALDRFDAVPALAHYVDRAAVPSLAGLGHDEAWLNVRPICLNYWLKENRHDGRTEAFRWSDTQDRVREPAARGVR